MKNYGYYGPGSATWKIASEAAITLGGTRAVLMQIAHPLVAMGVSDHSSYMTNPIGRAERTFVYGQRITFGSPATIRDAAHSINRLHAHVFGTLPDSAGAYTSGTPYRARDPELLLWVHATLIDTILLVYPLLIGPLSDAEQDRYYQESKSMAHLLGLLPSLMPETAQDLRQYVDGMVHSSKLAATPLARQLAHQVLFPDVLPLLRPMFHLNSQITCALLPQPVREIYGLEWSRRQQRIFDLSVRSLRAVLPRLPRFLRILPITHHLMNEGTLVRTIA